MSKQRETLKLALDALDCIYSPLHVREINKVGEAMVAIREALAEPEQEPVAWMHQPAGMSKIYSIEPIPGPDSIPLYAAPSARKPLTEPELHAIEPTWPNEWNYDDVLAFARAIERAHGIGSD